MRSLLILISYHHKNTERVANHMAGVLDATIKRPREVDPEGLDGYDLIGFGSGIYGAKHHKDILDLAERLHQVNGRKAIIFSTCGAPEIGIDEEYVVKVHTPLREKLVSKGYQVVGEFCCPGLNTNSFLKLFGGINKGRPNAKDLDRAEKFAAGLK